MKINDGDLGYSLTKGSNAFVDIKQLLRSETEFNVISTVHNRPSEQPLPDAKTSSFIARLPPKHIVDELVMAFFANVNWHYFILEKYYFDCLFACFSGAPLESVKHLSYEEIIKELRYFPAMLFQVLGLAIQFLPFESHVWKYLAPNELVTCHRYSDIGMELMTHLGRENVALTAVQADFLRAAWLKNIGKGVEAWYSVGNAIRSAQALELHRQKDIHQQSSTSLEKTLSQIWYEEYKRRVWMNLYIWDSLTAMILGRPRTIHPDDCDVQLPLECNIPHDPTTTLQGTREAQGERDSPNTVSTNLFMYRISDLWNTVKALKADKPLPPDSAVVQRLDEQLRGILEAVPPTLRHQNPNTSWDARRPYLVQQREDVLTKAHLLLTALHRPHMASRPASRRAALQSAIITLDSQQRSFARTSPHHYKLFGLSFYTVDASLLLSVVATMDLPLRDDVQANVDRVLLQAIKRLSVIEPHNPIARSGLAILHKCYNEFRARCERASALPSFGSGSGSGSRSARISAPSSSSASSQQRTSDSPCTSNPPSHDAEVETRHRKTLQDPAPSISGSIGALLSDPPTSALPAGIGISNDSTLNVPVSTASHTTEVSPLPSLAYDILQTTDFDESYWMYAIEQISPSPNPNPDLGPGIGATTGGGGAGEEEDVAGIATGEGEFGSVWNSLEFF